MYNSLKRLHEDNLINNVQTNTSTTELFNALKLSYFFFFKCLSSVKRNFVGKVLVACFSARKRKRKENKCAWNILSESMEVLFCFVLF